MAFAAVYSRTSSELERLVREYSKGTLTAEDFGNRAYDAIKRGHTDAYSVGLRHAGSQLNPLVLQHEAEVIGRAKADAENAWLDKFVSDLEDGRYTDAEGNLALNAVNQRADMYALKTRATANQGYIDASAANEPDEAFTWIMTALEHCADCPRMAALSPYKAHELFTTPGAGDTECLSHCACILMRHSDGLESFERP